MHRKQMEWQTRVLAAYVANTIQDDKARQQMVKQTESITMTGTPSKSGLPPLKKGQPMTEEEFAHLMEHGNTEAALEANSRRTGPMPF